MLIFSIAAVVVVFILRLVVAHLHGAFTFGFPSGGLLCLSEVLGIDTGLLQEVLKLFGFFLLLLCGLNGDTLGFKLSDTLLLSCERLLSSLFP